MALQIRRGTNAERLLIIPMVGELIYTIDTKKLYVGDGVTQGGNIVSGNDLQFIGDVKGSVISEDNTVLVDNVSNVISGNIEGYGSSSFTGNLHISASTITGDLRINANTVIGLDPNVSNPIWNYISTSTNGLYPVGVVRLSNVFDSAMANELALYKARGTWEQQTIVQPGDILGILSWSGFDGSSPTISSSISSIVNSVSTNNISSDMIIFNRNGDISTFSETIRFKADKGTVAQGYIQFGSFTTEDRNNIMPVAGMVIWNSTTSQFEGYNGSNWINLVNGNISI